MQPVQVASAVKRYPLFGKRKKVELNCWILCHLFAFIRITSIRKISLTSPIVINMPTRASLAVKTKDLSFLWLANLNNKSNVCKQISSLLHSYLLFKGRCPMLTKVVGYSAVKRLKKHVYAAVVIKWFQCSPTLNLLVQCVSSVHSA